jgi:uncharacterized protein (TIGR02611 family)
MPPAAVIRSLLVFNDKHPLFGTYKVAKRVAIGIVGGSILVVGVAMVVLPGPAFIVIPVGLGILGLEFAWARRWLKKVKEKAQDVGRSMTGRPAIDRSNPTDTH